MSSTLLQEMSMIDNDLNPQPVKIRKPILYFIFYQVYLYTVRVEWSVNIYIV